MHALPTISNRVLFTLVAMYTAASLLHFIHNATYLHDYPNLPAWITAFGVYAVWCAIASVGALGVWLYRRSIVMPGIVMLGIYALLGFAGLDHYVVAPVSAHSWAMNFTIAFEVLMAAVLFVATILLALRFTLVKRSVRQSLDARH